LKNLQAPLKIDALRAQIPAFFYRRVDLTQKPQEYFIIPIDYGFNFLLREIRTKWPKYTNEKIAISTNQLGIAFIQSHASRPLQNEPYPARLISSPAESGVYFVAETPPDPPPGGINFAATPVKNNLKLNYYYQHREAIDLRVQFTPINDENGFCDVLCCGYYIPDEHLDMWD